MIFNAGLSVVDHEKAHLISTHLFLKCELRALTGGNVARDIHKSAGALIRSHKAVTSWTVYVYSKHHQIRFSIRLCGR